MLAIKKPLAIFLALTMVFTLFVGIDLTAVAETEGIYTYEIEDGKAIITGCDSSTSGEITIPSTLGGYPVTSIGNYAFSYLREITSVTIPNSVISIDRYAFEDCSGLTSITVPDSVTSVGYHAFYETAWYDNQPDGLVYAGKVLYQVKGTCPSYVTVKDGTLSITYAAFYNCSGLNSITIPNSVVFIGEDAFYDCTGLTSVTIGNGVTSIEASTFEGCSALTSVTIGNNVTSIGSSAFRYCSGLTSVTIPDSVTFIGEGAFEDCTGLTSVMIGKGVTSIGKRAFLDCDSLKQVHISDLIAWCKIEFSDIYANPLACAKNLYLNGALLIDLVIPDSVISIENYAFYGCTGLTSVTIPDSVTSIGDYAFYGCTGLTSVTIGNGVTSIGSGTFYECTGLTSVTIGNNVTSIGSSAFRYCSGLTSVTIPDSVVSIGRYAFHNTVWLNKQADGLVYAGKVVYTVKGQCPTSITIQEGTLGIAEFAFSYEHQSSGPGGIIVIRPDIMGGEPSAAPNFNCKVLQTVFIPDSVKVIGDNAFQGCRSLKSITVDSKNPVYLSVGNCLIETESKTLIAGCQNSVIPTDGSVVSIDHYAFGYRMGMTEISIPDSVTSIGERAFYYCENLTSITIPGSVSVISEEAFYNCKEISSLVIEKGVTTIGKKAFYYCENLTSVTVPDSVTSIGDYAFYSCPIKDLVITEGSEKFTSTMLIGAATLETITIPKSVTSIVATFGSVSGYASGYYIIVIPGTSSERCENVKTVTVDPENPVYHSDGNCLIETANKTLIAGFNNSVIPTDGSVTTIGNGAFSGRLGLTDITIPNGVASIGDSAFSACKGLASIAIPDSVISIGDYAFSGCTGLTSIAIPDSVISIGEEAFYNCKGLTSITVSDRLVSIGWRAFYGCTVKNLMIAEGAKRITSTMVICDSTLETVTIPNSVTYVAEWAFNSCSSLTDVYYIGTEQQWKQLNIASYNDPLINATIHLHEHAFGEWQVRTPATCTEDGVQYRVCDCDEEETGTISAKGHEWGAWTTVKAVTCTEKGTETRVCSHDSSHTETREVKETGHNYQKQVIAPTCAKAGYTLYTCKNCGKNYKDDYVDALGHNWGAWKTTKAATCTQKGTEVRVCKRDSGHTETRDIKASGHTYKSVIIAPTCSERGYISHTCTICGNHYVDGYVNANGHNWSAWKTTKAATCTTAGTQTRVCENGLVSHKETRTIAAKGHKLRAVAAKEATTKSAGNKSYYKCTTCGKLFTDKTGKTQTTIAKVTVYKITYQLNGGTNHKSNPKTYTVTDTVTLKNPTKKGYTFKGWYSDSKFKTKVTKIAKNSTGNKTLYAKWTKDTYKITYKLNGGANNKNNPKTYDVTKAVTLKNLTRKGYTFVGWYSDAKCTKKVTKFAKGTTGNKTLYAKWKKR